MMNVAEIKEEYVVRNLHREAKLLSQLSHPCIAGLYETMQVCIIDVGSGGGRQLRLRPINKLSPGMVRDLHDFASFRAAPFTTWSPNWWPEETCALSSRPKGAAGWMRSLRKSSRGSSFPRCRTCTLWESSTGEGRRRKRLYFVAVRNGKLVCDSGNGGPAISTIRRHHASNFSESKWPVEDADLLIRLSETISGSSATPPDGLCGYQQSFHRRQSFFFPPKGRGRDRSHVFARGEKFN